MPLDVEASRRPTTMAEYDAAWDRMESDKVAALKDKYTVVRRLEQGPDTGIDLTLLVRNDLVTTTH